MKNKFIKKIDEAIISQVIEGDFSTYDEILKADGHNITDIENYAEKNFRKHSFLLKGIINKQKDLVLLERASILLQNAIENNIDKPISYLKSLIANNKFNVQYRNLDNLGIEEIKEIIKDQNLLELLEQLENDQK